MSLPVWPHVLSRGYGATSCLVPCSFQGVSGPREGPVWSQGGRVCYQEVSGPGGGLVWGRKFASVGGGGGFWSGPRGGMALPPGGQTNRCKSITFPQLRLRAVNIYTYFCDDWFAPSSKYGHRYRYHKFYCYNCLGQTDINILYSPKY